MTTRKPDEQASGDSPELAAIRAYDDRWVGNVSPPEALTWRAHRRALLRMVDELTTQFIAYQNAATEDSEEEADLWVKMRDERDYLRAKLAEEEAISKRRFDQAMHNGAAWAREKERAEAAEARVRELEAGLAQAKQDRWKP